MLTSKNLLNEYLDDSDEEDNKTKSVVSEPQIVANVAISMEKSKKRIIAMPQYQVKKSSVCDVSTIFSVVDSIEEKSIELDARPNCLPSTCSFLNHLPEPLNWKKNKKNTVKPMNDSETNSGDSTLLQLRFSKCILKSDSKIQSPVGLEQKDGDEVYTEEDQEEDRDYYVDESLQNPFIFSLSANTPLIVSEMNEHESSEAQILSSNVCNSNETNQLKVVDLALQETKDPLTCLVPNSNTYQESNDGPGNTFTFPKGREWQGFLLSERKDLCHESGSINPKTYVINGSDLSNPHWKENFRRGDGRLKPQNNFAAGVNCFNIALTSSRRQRQKNQINSLAQEVANKEHEYSERASQQRYSKYRTQMKYGW